MAASTSTQNSFKPPQFDGTYFIYWKERMTIFLKSIDFSVWNMVQEEYTPPTSDYEYWTNDAKKEATLNARAMNALYCAIDENEYNRISTCETAYEVWHSLEILHEGTNKVKEAKNSVLVHKYELFKVIKGESIKEMFGRFTSITTAVKSMVKTYSME